MARLEEESINTLDCRVCRREGCNRESRVCLLDRPDAFVARQTGDSASAFRVDGELAMAILSEAKDLRMEWLKTEGLPGSVDEGKPICAVACIDPWAYEAIAQEIDAKEYGRPEDLTSRQLEAFRVIRSERSACDSARFKAMKDKR
jgi:hypothetical protein